MGSDATQLPQDSGAAGDGAVSGPGAFQITGVTGPDDTTPDTWLVGRSTPPTVTWGASAGASGYEVTIFDEEGTTIKCPAQQSMSGETSATFTGCMLTDGLQYRASVIALRDGGRLAASNDKLRFAVGAVVLGQPDGNTNNGLRLGMALPNDVAVAGSRIIVADQNNSRVLIWNTLPTANHQQADLVLGQPDFNTGVPNYNGSQNGAQGSNSVDSDGTRLVVGDRYNHRVLIWNTFPTRNNQPPDVVVGQPDFATTTSNTGGVSARSMTEPWAWLGENKLFVSDRNNARVLIWNAIPTQNYAPADVVLGQPDMISTTPNNGGVSASSIADPGRGGTDGPRLFVPDLANHRVLIWNAIPTTNNAPANLVMGQTSMTANAPNAGGSVNGMGFNSPISAYLNGPIAAVADYLNNRVLVWNRSITTNGSGADVIMGQSGLSDNTPNMGGLSGATLNGPNAIALYSVGGLRLIISDRFNNRVLIYPGWPIASGGSASLVLGQPDFVSGRLINGGNISASMFAAPSSITRLGHRLAIADTGDDRTLVWDSPPLSRSDLPTVVLGQPGFTTSGQSGSSGGVIGGTATSARTACAPQQVSGDASNVVVGEQCGRRVAVWNRPPTEIQQAADAAVGQPDLMTSTANTGGISASTMNTGVFPCYDAQRLYVSDANNHRVLIFNGLPTASGQAANVVLGQPDMTANTANNGGISATSLALPGAIYVGGGKLFVADRSNHRVLIWNTLPTASRAPADVVLGQPDMVTGAAPTAVSARTLSTPRGMHVDDMGRLYIADGDNNRVLYWNTVPTESQAPADGVIGQPSFTSLLANNGGMSTSTLQGPSSMLAIGSSLYLVDGGNDRLLIMRRP